VNGVRIIACFSKWLPDSFVGIKLNWKEVPVNLGINVLIQLGMILSIFQANVII
jgi:hypothetical protein